MVRSDSVDVHADDRAADPRLTAARCLVLLSRHFQVKKPGVAGAEGQATGECPSARHVRKHPSVSPETLRSRPLIGNASVHPRRAPSTSAQPARPKNGPSVGRIRQFIWAVNRTGGGAEFGGDSSSFSLFLPSPPSLSFHFGITAINPTFVRGKKNPPLFVRVCFFHRAVQMQLHLIPADRYLLTYS